MDEKGFRTASFPLNISLPFMMYILAKQKEATPSSVLVESLNGAEAFSVDLCFVWGLHPAWLTKVMLRIEPSALAYKGCVPAFCYLFGLSMVPFPEAFCFL